MNSKLPGGLHMPQLDGLRTPAVAAVIWSHWVPPYQFGFEWGVMGVNLFFVLSGFLITGILLDSRAGAVRPGDRWFAIRQFYTRRVLRIFPPVLHDTGAAGTGQRPPSSSDFPLACLPPLECVFFSARRLDWSDQSFLVISGGGTVLRCGRI
jgi:hypothetical protein